MAQDPNADWANPPVAKVQVMLEEQGVPVRLPAGAAHTNIEKHALPA
jgi:hypothetical protein